jgi:heme/copper-type cytochrome/quinol oxidase subunit 2
MKGRSVRQILLFSAAVALVVLVALLLPGGALAQCPLCRSALENGSDKTARTMNLAIIVLLIPPVSIFCTLFAVAFRKRKGDDEDESAES